MIYAHIPKENKQNFSGGCYILENSEGMFCLRVSAREQREYQKQNESAGGSKDIDMLFSEDELVIDIPDLEIIKLEKCITIFRKAIGHNGESAIIRMIARKSHIK